MDLFEVPRTVSTRQRHTRLAKHVSLFLVLLGVASGPVSAERKLLQNDSFTGTATFSQLASFAEQEYAAASFTADPADYPFRIEKVQALVLGQLDGTIAMVSVTVWEEDGTAAPGTVIHTSTYGFQVESSSTAINELDLSCENIVIDGGTVRVGIRWEYIGDPINEPIGIAFDQDGIVALTNSLYAVSPFTGWWWADTLGVAGDWIIRLEIETDIAGSIFGDGFERGDARCWVGP
jgi:hypothetical protein